MEKIIGKVDKNYSKSIAYLLYTVHTSERKTNCFNSPIFMLYFPENFN
jgi:hypothetical protein